MWYALRSYARVPAAHSLKMLLLLAVGGAVLAAHADAVRTPPLRDVRLDDASLKAWIPEECRRLLSTKDANGYIGSYAGRHRYSMGQCGYAYNHCCVDNAARTFLDVASVAVARGADGVFRLNLYQDATATLDGVKFVVRGDYPAHGRVTVRVEGVLVRVGERRPRGEERLHFLGAFLVDRFSFRKTRRQT